MTNLNVDVAQISSVEARASRDSIRAENSRNFSSVVSDLFKRCVLYASMCVVALVTQFTRAADRCNVVDQSCNVTRVGAAAKPADGPPSFPGNGNGNKGGDGGSAAGITLDLLGSDIYRNSGLFSPLQVVSGGADGAQGSNATKSGFNKRGGDGGTGGAAGAINLTVGPQVGGLSLGPASAATIAAVGGTGGAAGIGNQSGAPGTAGVGGNGGAVTATVAGGWTANKGAALFVQSQGGDGGRGRWSAVGYSTLAPDGNRGGNGGAVNVSLLGQFIGLGGGARVFSAGGNGGDGGEGGSGSGGAGGSGGKGGAGGNVGVTIGATADIYTSADLNAALWVQSLGGAGGNGGGGGSGGRAGAGGAAGNVTVNTQGGVLTSRGYYSAGLLAQSLGGTGANGGNGSSWAVGPNGGAGNTGGAAGNVTVSGEQITIRTGGQQADEGSPGVLAQSIGGGGGTGGNANGAFAIGGRGGSAVSGEAVTINLQANVATGGLNSEGIVAQSIGGGGGKGGNASGTSGLINLTVGGTAGGGGRGGSVSSTLQAGSLVTTLGEHADGMLLQSIGGGGGDGGAGYSSAYSGGLGASVALGGTGGEGGAGGKVGFAPGQSTTNAGEINTAGADAYGILGQSIGGGGGQGGESAAKMRTYGVGQYPSIAVAAAIGGAGGKGGQGDSVTLGNTGRVTTLGAGATAIVGESIGGGGGAGGDSSAEATASGKGVNISASMALGGKGGSAGNGGNVSVTNSGVLATGGETADGMLLQSIGGGGGAGGFGDGSATGKNGKESLAVTLTLGGNGGGGGAGGGITATNSGDIMTQGDGGIGILAQSIGGGGGLAGGGAGSASGTLTLTTYVGGVAGTGGNVNGAVTVLNNGSVSTLGADASAIFAQSIGGGGGLAGKGAATLTDNDTLADVDASTQSVTAGSINLTLGIGGRGGTGGYASAVNIMNGGNLRTAGAMSNGIVAQAIGGGGGKGGEVAAATSTQNSGSLNVGGTSSHGGGNGGNGGQPTVVNKGNITTSGSLAAGIITQSIAGGGGIGEISASSATSVGSGKSTLAALTVGVGGSGGAAGTSGQAVVDNSGRIVTQGHDSIGIIAQSIAGGGGIAETLATDLDTNGSSAPDYGVNAKFGGSGNSTGSSGLVKVTTAQGGDIVTYGDNSYGILAQSIAGGGGLILGGSAQVPSNKDFFGSGTMSGSVINDPNGNPGNSGMWIDTGGNITTSGKGATAIFAQSIGGGGGLAGNKGWTEQLINFTPSSKHNGSGGAINIKVEAGSTIRTAGSNAPAIIAQSIGGGGGRITTKSGAFNGTAGGTGQGGKVNITIDGTVQATGQASMGIYAQSVGDKNSSSPISITVDSGGLVSGGPLFNGNGDVTPALYLDHGGMNAATANSVINAGTLTSVGQERGTAIYGNYGYTVVQNSGLIVGSIKLGNNGGSGNVINTGTIRSGSLIDLAGGSLVNNGLLEVGAHGAFPTTTVKGNFVQGAGATLLIDTGPAGQADILDVTGTADISGSVRLQGPVAKTQPVEALEASGGVTLLQPQVIPRGLPIYFKEFVVGHALDIETVGDFTTTASGLNGSDRQVAAQLQGIWDSGSSLGNGFSEIATLKNRADYISMLNSLSAQSFGDLAAVRYLNTQSFLDPMDQGCARDVRDDSCGWIRLADGQIDRGNTSAASGYSAHQHLLQVGGTVELAHDLTLNGSIGYAWEDLNVSGGTAGVNGGSTTAAVGLAYRPGLLELGADLAVGYAGYNSERTITVGTGTGQAQAHPELWNADLRLSVAYDIPLASRWTLKPFAHLDLAEVGTSGFDEKGPTDFNLIIDGQSHGALSGQTGLELTADVTFENGLIVRPLLSAGVEGLDGGNWGPTARFAAAPGVPGSRPLVTLPDALGDLAAGLQVSRGRTWNIQVRYDLQAGDSYRSQSGGALFTMKF
jgi:hypothetical protein